MFTPSCLHPPPSWRAPAQALLNKEVLNLDAVEAILGQRPFTSATLRNIDRYRQGGGEEAPAEGGAEAAAEMEADAKEEEQRQEGGGGGGGVGGGGGKEDYGRRRAADPGMVVAT